MTAEQFAYNAFLTGFALTAIASISYVTLALWPRVVYRAAAILPEGRTGATMSIAASASGGPAWLGPAASASTWLAVLALTASLAARWAAGGRPPYANMWEFTVGFGWGILLAYALFELRFRQSDGWP